MTAAVKKCSSKKLKRKEARVKGYFRKSKQ